MLYPNLIQLIVTYYVLLQWWKTHKNNTNCILLKIPQFTLL